MPASVIHTFESLVAVGLIAILVGGTSCLAQTDSIPPRSEFRLYAARGIYSVSSDLPLPVDTETGQSCGAFSDGSGSGLALSVGLDHDLWDVGGIGFAATLFSWDVSSSFPCHEEAEIRMPDGSLVPAVTEFVRKSEGLGMSLGFETYLRPISGVRVSIGAVYIAPLSTDVTHDEEVQSPDGATFLDGRGSRAVDGVAEGRQLQFLSGTFSAEYRLRAGKEFYLTPGVRLSIPVFSPDTRDSDLAALYVGLGASYRFNLFDPEMSTPLEPARR